MTVVIPTYNRAALLMETVGSVVAQTYPNWELIVANDGSTDDTVGRLTALGHPNIRVLIVERQGHLGRLRGMGVASGRGDFVAFLDSDDLWLPQKLEKQVRAVEVSGAEWCYTEYTLFDGETGEDIGFRAGGSRATSRRLIRALLQDQTGIAIGTVLIGRPFYDRIGGLSESPSLAYRDDLDIALRLARASEPVAVPEKLMRLRQHRGRTTAALSDADERTAMVFQTFLEHETDPDLIRRARRRLGQCLSDAAAHHLSRGDVRRALSFFRKSLTAGGLQQHVFRKAAQGKRNLMSGRKR